MVPSFTQPKTHVKVAHNITYKSGGNKTQVDYILYRKGFKKEVTDCKVIAGEAVAPQQSGGLQAEDGGQQQKWSGDQRKETNWKLERYKKEFLDEVKSRCTVGVLLDSWEEAADVIWGAAEKALGWSSGKKKKDKETWWWSEEVQEAVKKKREAKKNWDLLKNEDSRDEYKRAKETKRKVGRAKAALYRELYDNINGREGEKLVYRIAKQRDVASTDVQQVWAIKDNNREVLTNKEEIVNRWREYFVTLMCDKRNTTMEEEVSREEVKRALTKMKRGKAVGPDAFQRKCGQCLTSW